MFAEISPQQGSQRGGRSVKSFINYLEKENEGKSPQEKELFFNQQSNDIHPSTVIDEIQSNMGRLKSKTAPTYDTMTISPSQYELAHIGNNTTSLKEYTRSVMKDYASTFHQEINGRPIKVDDVKYYAKIEHHRHFTGRDSAVWENAPFLKQITALNKEIQLIQRGELDGNVNSLKEEIKSLKATASHKINGQLVKPGLKKEGFQTQVHLILSRRDVSNSIGLSPGGSHLKTEMILWGKPIKHGFNDDIFKQKAENTFDRMFTYNRNFVAHYKAMKTFKRDPEKYYTQLHALSTKEKRVAFMILRQTDLAIPQLSLSADQINFALKQIKKAIEVGFLRVPSATETMIMLEPYMILLQWLLAGLLFSVFLKISNWGYLLNLLLIAGLILVLLNPIPEPGFLLRLLLLILIPISLLNTVLYVFITPASGSSVPKKYQMRFSLKKGKIVVRNIRRGASIIGAAGSGKTESVVYNFLKHFSKYSFCGVIHDYKSLELTEIAYPLFKKNGIPFYIVSFDKVYHRVNPIAPRYLPDQESVNELSRDLLENLLEQKDSIASGTTRFFNDTVEGLISGLIWKLKTSYPEYCTLPHLIALYQYLDTESLVAFLSSNTSSKAMADAFISGVESERQTAAVKSTLANALKKISTQRIFMALSADEVPLDINNSENPAVVSIVNNPKFETAYSPAIATILHTITKQMSVRARESSFILMEEAPTIRLLHMHRIPATLRSYDITTVYVMQDKVQNELLYGEKASRAILSNLSYQFFGKVNDPDTAKYYERFFEIVKRKSVSTSQSDGLDFDTRITKSEREVSKIRADLFFRLKPGEFVTFADGKDQTVAFKLENIEKQLPQKFAGYSEDEIQENFEKIYLDVQAIFS